MASEWPHTNEWTWCGEWRPKGGQDAYAQMIEKGRLDKDDVRRTDDL
jgi:hypothetical protein